MKSGKDPYDQSLLDSLEKKYQLFLDSPNGEINVFLVLSKVDDENKSEISIKTQSHVPSANFAQHQGIHGNYNYNNYQNYSPNISHSSFNRQVPLQQNKSYKNQKNYSDNDMININHFS